MGGGNAALEEALYLSQIASIVHLVHRRDTFRAEPIMVDRLMDAVNEGKIVLHTPYEVKEVLGNDNAVNALAIRNTENDTVDTITVDGVFIAIGHSPNTKIFDGQVTMQDGYIVTETDPRARTATNIKGVFAAATALTRSTVRQSPVPLRAARPRLTRSATWSRSASNS